MGFALSIRVLYANRDTVWIKTTSFDVAFSRKNSQKRTCELRRVVEISRVVYCRRNLILWMQKYKTTVFDKIDAKMYLCKRCLCLWKPPFSEPSPLMYVVSDFVLFAKNMFLSIREISRVINYNSHFFKQNVIKSLARKARKNQH